MRTSLGKQRMVWAIHRNQRGRSLQLDGKNITKLALSKNYQVNILTEIKSSPLIKMISIIITGIPVLK